jgi:hypothetical protein
MHITFDSAMAFLVPMGLATVGIAGALVAAAIVCLASTKVNNFGQRD